MPEDPKPAAVDALIDGLRDDGRSAEAGKFTLDGKAALRKMQDYQLAAPHHYVLELVQAATHKGATWIDFQIDSDDMWMRFDGEPYTARQLEDIYPAVFRNDTDSDTRSRAQLGLGLNSARALDLRWVRVVSGKRGERVALMVKPGTHDEVKPTQDEPGTPKGHRRVTTEIHVKTALHSTSMDRVMESLSQSLPEESVLVEKCSHSTLELTLDGERFSKGLHLDGAVAVTPFEGPGLRGMAGLRPEGEPARVRLVLQGVELSTHELPDTGDLGFEALVEADGLRKDVSQSDVVKNGRYEEVIGAVQRTRASLAKDEDAQRALGMARRDAALRSLHEFYPDLAAQYALAGRLYTGSIVGAVVCGLTTLGFPILTSSGFFAGIIGIASGSLFVLCLLAILAARSYRKSTVVDARKQLTLRFPPNNALRYHAFRMVKSRRQTWDRALGLHLQKHFTLD